MTTLPALFISHGAPSVVIEDTPARRFLADHGRTIGRPNAILVVSAHWETAVPTVGAAARPDTIHDFRGFPRALYEIRYPAPGAPDLARRAAALLEAAAIPAQIDPARGYDHGVWVPLSLLYPDADIPVVPVSVQPRCDPRHHFAVGAALRPLRAQGVLIVASGSATHNLSEFRTRGSDAAMPGWAAAFSNWLTGNIEAGRTEDLLDYRRLAPEAERNHPTDEHLLPLFTALGAGTPGLGGHRIHKSHDYGVISMDAYAFG